MRNDEEARQGLPDKRSSAVEDTTTGGRRDDAHFPSVSVILKLEASPRIVVDAANEADELALRRWIRECRPDLDRMLRTIASELRDKKQAA